MFNSAIGEPLAIPKEIRAPFIFKVIYFDNECNLWPKKAIEPNKNGYIATWPKL